MHLEDIPGEDFDTHLLYRERIFLFHAARTQQPRSTTWDHVLNRQLCVLNSAVPEPIQDRLMQCTAQTIRTDSIDVLSAHVATGKYSAVLPQSLAGQLAHIPNLHAIAINGPMSHSNVGFVAGKNAFEAPSSRALLEMVHTPNSPPLFNPLYRSIVGSSPKQTHLKAPEIASLEEQLCIASTRRRLQACRVRR